MSILFMTHLHSDEEKLNYEKEFIGVFVSGHPLEDLPYKPWNTILDGESFSVGGYVKSVRKHKTKGKGELMAFVKLETQAEELDLTIFPRTYKEFEERIFKGNIIIAKGKKQVQSNGREGLLIDSIGVPRKKKHKVERDLDEAPLEFESQKATKKQQQLFDNDELPPLTPKADPLAALFGD